MHSWWKQHSIFSHFDEYSSLLINWLRKMFGLDEMQSYVNWSGSQTMYLFWPQKVRDNLTASCQMSGRVAVAGLAKNFNVQQKRDKLHFIKFDGSMWWSNFIYSCEKMRTPLFFEQKLLLDRIGISWVFRAFYFWLRARKQKNRSK